MVTAGQVGGNNLQERGFYSLVRLAQALGNHDGDQVQICVVSNGLREVIGNEILCPDKAPILGPCKVIPQEYPNIRCRSIDIELERSEGSANCGNAAVRIVRELLSNAPEPAVAWRGHHRWVETVEPVRLAESGVQLPLRERGTYLITGGLSGIGLVLADYLARAVGARLVLAGRLRLPSRTDWNDWVAQHEHQDPVTRRIREVQKLEACGGEVLPLTCDVTDIDQMRELLARGRRRFGEIHGVVHSAGVPGGGIIQHKDASIAASVLAPKMRGARVLDELLADTKLDFFVLCSSLSSVVGGVGQVDYCAANAFLDAFARERAMRTSGRTLSISWDKT